MRKNRSTSEVRLVLPPELLAHIELIARRRNQRRSDVIVEMLESVWFDRRDIQAAADEMRRAAALFDQISAQIGSIAELIVDQSQT